MKRRGIFLLALLLCASPVFAQVNPGSSPLSGPKGGTGNAFMQFSGPASAIKTYALPNSSDTIATLAATQTLSNKTLLAPNIGIASGTSLTLSTASFDTGSGTAGRFITFDATGLATNYGSVVTGGGPSVFFFGGIESGRFGTVAGALTLGVAGSTQGTLTFSGATGGGTKVQALASASGTLTLPSATDQLVARATTDTLTNKSISGASNTLSGIANASLTNSSVTINGTNIALGASGTVTAAASSLAPGTTTVSPNNANGLLYTNGSGLLTNLASGNNGVVVTGATGIPAVSGTLPANVTASTLTSVGALSGGSATTGFTISASNVTWAGTVPAANLAVANLAASGNGGVTGNLPAAQISGNLPAAQVSGTTTNDNASAGNIGQYMSSSTNGTTATVTISNASPGIITWAANTLNVGSGINFTTTGGLPTGLTVGVNYYVCSASFSAGASFAVATSVTNAFAGTCVNTSSAGSGTQTAASKILMTSVTGIDCTGLPLTGGDWEVSGTLDYVGGTTTTVAYLLGSVSATSATLDNTVGRRTSFFLNNATPFASIDPTLPLVPTRVPLASGANYFLVAFSNFGVSTETVTCQIQARRMR